MTRTRNKLTARAVASATKPGRYGDGGGLALVVSADGRRRWVFRYTRDGKSRDMGLGAVRDVSLAEAREAAEAARRALRDGHDPITAREEERRAAEPVPTFGAIADQMLETIESGFRNEKHRAQWRMTLTEYARALRPMPVDEIGTEDVLAALRPIWTTKNETASRLRGRIERVLDTAMAMGHRRDANPARWRGHLDKLLPKRPPAYARGNHAAMPFTDVPDFMARLGEIDGLAARALEFTILTAARSGETLGAEWSEIDLEAGVWTIPAARMKAGRVHRVPLSGKALDLLRALPRLNDGFVFPGARKGKPLSNMAMAMCLRRLVQNVTVHGFRSAFRDWAGDRTHFPREIAEAALAHTVGDMTERAYRRSDALERRRELMEAWAGFIEQKPANVVTLAPRGAA